MKLATIYGIEFDGDKYHSATYDVTKTYRNTKKDELNSIKTIKM